MTKGGSKPSGIESKGPRSYAEKTQRRFSQSLRGGAFTGARKSLVKKVPAIFGRNLTHL